QNMADSSIRMVTWSFVRRTIAGKPGPDGVNPSVTIIHRRRGLVTRIEAPVDDPYVARIEAQFSFEGRVLTRTFDWNLSRNASRKVLWELRPHPSETYVLIYAVNDPNVRFQVTPRSLIEANEKAMASLQSMRNPNAARSALGHIPNFTTNTVENQLLKLQKISDGDASAVIKGEAKRQAVIVLAQRYERQAIHNKALANEQRLRAKMELATARHLELNAWVNLQKASLLRGQLPTADLAGLERGANLVRPNDLELTLNTIAEADRDVAKYQQATTGKSLSDKAQDYAQFFRRAQVQGNRADELRADAKKRLASTYASDAKVTEYYLRSLKMWKEYILRTEGLQKEERGLFERGLVKSPLPPDPLIPEILLRQGWIYRELGLPDEAVDTFFGVLASSIRQEVDNLVRFNRISLVAQSQIANAYYEAPQKLEDYKLAVEKLEIIMMQPAGERAEDHELDLEQIQLRYMRALYKAIRAIDSRLTRDNRRIKFLKNGTLASDKLLSQITVLAKDRNEHWRSLAKQSALFIEQYTKTQSSQSVRYDGEVRYYKILAHQALGNEQHVQREVEVLLQNSSVTSELEAVWANTRLQIVMDIANLLYAEAIQLQGDVEHLGQLSGEATPVLGAANTLIRPRLQDSVQTHLTAAITYYTWAQKRDQSYRSQIFLRQQLAFCHERLGQKSKALNYYNQLLRLLKLHPSDLTPALMLVKNTTVFRQKNLQTEIEQLNKIN
ncbi:MAG: tetratricopeptide repeat protein, partial [Verrucomicrobiales bacterium]|nr:tetratricopeptide repeat protein [Verrucomicrobiales bacterium]